MASDARSAVNDGHVTLLRSMVRTAGAHRRSVQWCLCVSCAALIAVETPIAYQLDDPMFWLMLSELPALLLLVRWPKVCAAPMTVIFAACTFMPDSPDALLIIAQMMMLAIVAYRCSRRTVLSYAVGSSLIACLSLSPLFDGSWTGRPQVGAMRMMNATAMMLMAAVVGRAMLWKDEARRAAVAERAIERERELAVSRRRSLELSRDVHDTVAGRLSYVAMVCEGACIDESRSEKDRRLFAQLNDQVLEALRGVRAVIAAMLPNGEMTLACASDGASDSAVDDAYDDVDCTADRTIAIVSSAVAQSASSQQERLLGQGFGGDVLVEVADGVDVAQPCDENSADEMKDLLLETFSNVARHAEKGRRAYRVWIRFAAEGMQIESSNQVALRSSRGGEGGQGLECHRQIVALLHGRLEAGTGDDGRWRLHALIPYAGFVE